MFHVGGHKGSRGRSTALSKSYHNIFNDWKRPLRCGIQFCTLSCILFVAGVVLTWLGIHDIFGETVPITGPILLTVGALFLILASRQFFLAHSRKKLKATLKDVEGQDGKKTVVVDADDGNGASTIVMDHTGDSEKNGLHDDDDNHDKLDGDHPDDKHPISPSLEPGTYVWPSLPYHPSPFACISMMLGKDPSSIFAPPPPSMYGYAYSPGTASTSLSPSRPDQVVSPTSPATDSSLQQFVIPPAAAVAGPLSLQPASVPLGTVAVLEASDLHGSSNTQASTLGSTAQKTSSVQNGSTENNENHTSSKKPKALSPDGLPAMVARDGINNFPNRTAIMMLKTLELQETI